MKGILEDALNITRTDPARPTLLQVILTYPGWQALAFQRLAHWLWSRNRRLSALLLTRLARQLTGVEIHPGATVGNRVFIDHGFGVVIGETAVIEDDVVIMHGVTLGNRRNSPGKRHPTIRKGSFIGAGAVVLGDITVGPGARVGAGAVVLEDVPDGATALGNPARVLRKRSFQPRM